MDSKSRRSFHSSFDDVSTFLCQTPAARRKLTNHGQKVLSRRSEASAGVPFFRGRFFIRLYFLEIAVSCPISRDIVCNVRLRVIGKARPGVIRLRGGSVYPFGLGRHLPPEPSIDNQKASNPSAILPLAQISRKVFRARWGQCYFSIFLG